MMRIPSRPSDAGPDESPRRYERDEDGDVYEIIPDSQEDIVIEDQDPCAIRQSIFDHRRITPTQFLDELRTHDQTCAQCIVLRAQEAEESLIEQAAELSRIDSETGCTGLEMQRREISSEAGEEGARRDVA